jgi:hypothetical protein
MYTRAVDERDHLPIFGQDPETDIEEEAPSCAPKVYVSMEEASLLQAMRDIKDRAATLRERLADESSDENRTDLEQQLDALRKQFFELSQRRERAYLRKMVMLGHLPASALDD